MTAYFDLLCVYVVHCAEAKLLHSAQRHAHWHQICNFSYALDVAPWWWFSCEPKHVGAAFIILNILIISGFKICVHQLDNEVFVCTVFIAWTFYGGARKTARLRVNFGIYPSKFLIHSSRWKSYKLNRKCQSNDRLPPVTTGSRTLLPLTCSGWVWCESVGGCYCVSCNWTESLAT